MKKVIKIISFNIALLVILLIILEILLRLAGMNTIFEIEKKKPGWKSKYKRFAEMLTTQELEFDNSFYTDSDGIFRANPGYFAGRHDPQKNNKSINRDGFRGNAFQYVDTPRTKILLIGDSFTWGSTAQPITNCFADLLQQAGYYVYNGGIPGTDPQQYALIARKYVPLLKPDIVAVCLYLGNDVSGRPLIIKPNKNLHYVTNFGYLLGYDDNGNFFKNARDAFTYIKNRKCGQCDGPWSYFLFKTVVGRGVYKILNYRRYSKFDQSRKWVTKALEEIRATCKANDSQLMLFIIPFVNRDTQKAKTIEKNVHLFKGFQYYYPANFQKSDYQMPPDRHFNNQGHRKFADFIIDRLKQNGYPIDLKETNP